jgi:hydrophobic/amphiphilic exporter-1 (mainly G- bacteria), HAE1 family
MTISELSVRRPVFALMLISFLVVLGVFSFRGLGVDLFPKADPANVTINVSLPGATPEEIATQVILPLEEAVNTISGLDELSSQTSEGSGRITCTFVLERDLEGAAQDVREKVAGALRNLPPNILPPVIQKADPDADPVMTIAVASGKNIRETTEIADKQIKRVLETVDGVGTVTLTGGRSRQIRLYADAEKLNAYGITINQFRASIQNENVEIPGGRIIRGDAEVGVRTLGRVDAVSQFGDIIIANVKGSPIRVRDIGRVEDTYAEPTTWNMVDGKQSVKLDVRRQSGTNTVAIVDLVRGKLDQVRKSLPPGVDVKIIADKSIFINASVEALKEHLLYGSLLASLVVLLFIRNLRSVLIASLAIPTSIIATFTLLKAMNFTLNNMTLLGLTLAVGIVIDDAIVVLENIVRFIEEKYELPKTAAIDATREITLAVVATTVSLVIIFVPIAFMTGYAKRYVNEFGWTMAFAVMVSMLVSFTLTPMLSSLLLKRRAAEPGQQEHTSRELGFFHSLSTQYGRLMAWSLNHRFAVVLLTLAVFATAIPLNSVVGRDWIPADDQSELTLYLNMPIGTSLEANARILSEITGKIKQVRGVEFVNPYIPQEISGHSHTYIRLIDVSKRDFSQQDVARDIRKIMEQYPNIRSRVNWPSALQGGEGSSPINVRFLGPDLLKVGEYARKVYDRLKTTPGFTDVDMDLDINSPEFQIQIDRQRASDLGVRAADVAGAVRLMIAGEDEISTYKEAGEQYPVTMQLLPEQQKDPDVLARLMIPSTKVGQVRLDNIASLQRGLSPGRLKRYNRQYQVSVQSNLTADIALDDAAQKVREAVSQVGLPPGYSTRFSGTVKILDDTNKNLIITFLLASVFMYMVLAAQFESLLHPFSIMMSLPLSIPFALVTLWLTGRTLNLWSSLGVLLLLGIVKKNGILQVDYANKLRREGVPLREAILEACQVRLRPILMTTASIVGGLIPTAIGVGAGAAQRSAIAVTIIGGQTLCLLLTLIVTPVTYSLLSELSQLKLAGALKAFLSRGAAEERGHG